MTAGKILWTICLAVLLHGASVAPALGEGNEGHVTGEQSSIGEAVDLGLSVMWGDRNVGASSEVDYGNYYGYGDVTGEVVSTSYEDYLSQDVSGTDRDPAALIWGPGWRMPRTSEIAELVERCSWRWTKRKGVWGYVVTGRDGSSIFLPATGHRTSSKFFYVGTRGYYWGGEVNELNPNYAGALVFFKNDHFSKDYRKIYGFAIRPVHE